MVEFIFAATEEAIFVHVLISAKFVKVFMPAISHSAIAFAIWFRSLYICALDVN